MHTSQQNGDAVDVPSPRLIPHVVSEHAKNTPQKVWGSLPKSLVDASEGYEDITFARLNYAVTRAATWLMDTVEPQRSRKFEALAYLGPPDSRYVIFAIAAIKVGFQMLFLSPRNSDEAQYSVLEQANCQKFLCSTSMGPRVEKLIQSRPGSIKMLHYVVPEQEALLKDEAVPDFPYEKTIEEARYHPLVTLHTSSTTGMPKTIHLNQGYGFHEDVVQHVPIFNDLDIITRKPFYGQCRMFVAMPLFHAGGVLLTLLKSLYHDIVSVFQPPSISLNSQVFDAILRHGKCSGCVIPPYLLEDMLAVPSYFDTLASLDFVQFGSGPLSKAAGDTLLSRQKSCPHYIGSSECGLYLLLELDDPIEDWQYFRFHPWSGADMRPLDGGGGGDDNTRELFIVKRDAPKTLGLQPVFELFPELTEWPTKDLYVRHPTKTDHWRYIGRSDDVLVLSNGEKLNPVETEGRIANNHPSVSGALVIGKGRFVPGLLIEVRDVDVDDPVRRAKLVDEIWPSIKAANKAAPGYGQLMKSLILFTTPGKPFLRTPKLSIRRGPTIDSYASEINEMYDRYENDVQDSESDIPSTADLSSINGVQKLVLDSVHMVTGWELLPSIEDDLFVYGLDSLHVARIARLIRQVYAHNSVQSEFSNQIIYNHPTIRDLSEKIFKLTAEPGSSAAENQLPREESIERLINEHSSFTFQTKLQNGSISNNTGDLHAPANIMLTGSTGSLGSYILQSLLANPRVAQVYCLNRSPDAQKRQLEIMKSQGIDESTLKEMESRVHFLHAKSLDAPLLGLADAASYSSLQSSGITHIIHNAWPVNFNLSITSFVPHIAGVRALVEFCVSLQKKPQIHFVSSLSSVTALGMRTQVPEKVIFDASAPSKMGYGESKYAAERVLNSATELSEGGISTTILRVGQIAGPVKGSTAVWPVREWLPSLVISSKAVGALPTTLGRMNSIDWVPVDLLADCINELLDEDVAKDQSQANGAQTGHQSSVYHVLNTTSISWADLLPTVKAEVDVPSTVSLADWIELVRKAPDHLNDKNPAKKILPFYEALVESSSEQNTNGTSSVNGAQDNSQKRYEVVKLAEKSKTFREIGPVRKEWMAKWISQWF